MRSLEDEGGSNPLNGYLDGLLDLSGAEATGSVSTSISNRLTALEYFKEEVLSSSIGDCIAKIVLFGSVAKGQSAQESDIDVAVFVADKLGEAEEVCADISFQAAVRFKESMAPLVYCLDDLRFIGSYFIFNLLRTGKEIYSMGERELRLREAKGFLGLAKEYLAGADDDRDRRNYRIAVDAGYNAAELCIKGLLLLRLDDIPRTHGGIIGKFGELYVVEGGFDREKGKALNRLLYLRNKARYDFHYEIGEGAAALAVDLAGALIRFLEERIRAEEGQPR